MLTASNIDYDVADRTRALGVGGIGAMHLLAQRTGLIERLDERAHLLKVHLPYYESDHVLNIAYNVLSGARVWRTSNCDVTTKCIWTLWWPSGFPIPHPRGAGEFCGRFTVAEIESLPEVINETRLAVWQQQSRGDGFFEKAVIYVDGTLAPTTGEFKAGEDLLCQGQWSYIESHTQRVIDVP